MPPPPPKVDVAPPVQRSITRYLETTGNTAPIKSVDLVALVQGFLQSIDYQDGDFVRQGATLFTIEPETYKLKLEQAQAAEAGSQASLTARRLTAPRPCLRRSAIAGKSAGVEQVITIAGISALDNSSSLANAGVAYLILKEWSERGKGQDLRSLFVGLNEKLSVIPEARIPVIPPPPIQGIGNAAGFSMQVQLRDGNADYGKLQAITGAIVAKAQTQSALQRVSHSYQEKIVGGQIYLAFGLAMLLVYLVLAGQYESWYAPISVILAVPLSLIGPMAVLTALRIDNNLYTQIGLILLIALSAKNAILIVEVAFELHVRDGKPVVESAVAAALARFRPILMTSFAFILGVVPLVLATGASARKSIGITVFSGVLASACLAVLFVPAFFVVVQGFENWLAGRKGKKVGATIAPQTPSTTH